MILDEVHLNLQKIFAGKLTDVGSQYSFHYNTLGQLYRQLDALGSIEGLFNADKFKNCMLICFFF